MTLGDIVVCAHCKRTGGDFVLFERALVHPVCRGARLDAERRHVVQCMGHMTPQQWEFLIDLRAYRRAAHRQRPFIHPPESA